MLTNLIPFIVLIVVCNAISCLFVINAYRQGYEEIEIYDDNYWPIKIIGMVLCMPGFYFARDVIIAVYEKFKR